jgi:DNA-binding transcriptional MocR family regulator
MIEHTLPQAKVVYVPGAAFFALEPETNHARFNFSALPEAQLTAGMERLGKLLCQAIG